MCVDLIEKDIAQVIEAIDATDRIPNSAKTTWGDKIITTQKSSHLSGALT